MTTVQLDHYSRIKSPTARAEYLVRIGDATDISDAYSQMAKRRAALQRERKLRSAEVEAAYQKRVEQARGPYFD